jgi:hypothetical protein
MFKKALNSALHHTTYMTTVIPHTKFCLLWIISCRKDDLTKGTAVEIGMEDREQKGPNSSNGYIKEAYDYQQINGKMWNYE